MRCLKDFKNVHFASFPKWISLFQSQLLLFSILSRADPFQAIKGNSRIDYILHCSTFLTVCNFIVHEKCVTNVVTPCSGVAPCLIKNPVAHCWSEPTHHKRRFCNVCRKRLDETSAVHCLSKLRYLKYFYIILTCFLPDSMRVLRAYRVPGLRHRRLHGKCNVRPWQGTRFRKACSSLAWGEFTAIFQMRLLQENLLVVWMLDRYETKHFKFDELL